MANALLPEEKRASEPRAGGQMQTRSINKLNDNERVFSEALNLMLPISTLLSTMEAI
jgi:hypothetical protein